MYFCLVLGQVVVFFPQKWNPVLTSNLRGSSSSRSTSCGLEYPRKVQMESLRRAYCTKGVYDRRLFKRFRGDRFNCKSILISGTTGCPRKVHYFLRKAGERRLVGVDIGSTLSRIKTSYFWVQPILYPKPTLFTLLYILIHVHAQIDTRL